jgi:DNA-binding CsgD family transcriptional regulator/lambda repressor-like predicted transcriptional regulator
VKHGTLNAYSRHGCRCDPCRAKASRHSKEWRRDKYLGVVKLVDADPLREHVAMLMAAGMSFKAIALTAGWASRNALADAITRKRVMPRTLARVLAVNPELDNRRDAYTDATGSARRLQALAVNGWPTRTLAKRLGHKDPATIQNIARGQTPTIRLRTKDGIRNLYNELWDQAGPSKRTADIAKARGWLPALAWDDDLIDRPEHEADDVRRRKVNGGGSCITMEDIAEAREQGYDTAQQIGWRLGVHVSTVSQILSRADRKAS